MSAGSVITQFRHIKGSALDARFAQVSARMTKDRPDGLQGMLDS